MWNELGEILNTFLKNWSKTKFAFWINTITVQNERIESEKRESGFFAVFFKQLIHQITEFIKKERQIPTQYIKNFYVIVGQPFLQLCIKMKRENSYRCTLCKKNSTKHQKFTWYECKTEFCILAISELKKQQLNIRSGCTLYVTIFSKLNSEIKTYFKIGDFLLRPIHVVSLTN